MFLKKNQNAPRPSEHPPVRGEKMSKRLGWIKGCKYKTSIVDDPCSVYCPDYSSEQVRMLCSDVAPMGRQLLQHELLMKMENDCRHCKISVLGRVSFLL